MKYIYILLFIPLFFVSACDKKNPQSDKTVIATVFDKYLYLEDLRELSIEGMSAKDSSVIVKNKIDLWVKKQLMLNKAEIYLSDEQKDVEKNVEDYRASLLIYRYKQEFIKQKLDTNVSDEQVEKYYKENLNSFIMNGEAAKAILIKLPKGTENIFNFKKVFFAKTANSQQELINYCKKNAIPYNNFDGEWVLFFEISNMLPVKIGKPEIVLKANDFLQVEDENFFYYVKFNEYRLKGEEKPLKFVKDQIRSVILNKRKVEIIDELENTIYSNAIESENVKIVGPTENK